MDSVRDLISVFLKIAVALFIIVLILMFSSFVPKGENKKALNASSTPPTDILPSPRKYSGFFSASTTKRGVAQAPIFNAPDSFSYSGAIAFSSSTLTPVRIIGATTTSTGVVSPQVAQQNAAVAQEMRAARSAYVRNLSIYEGGAVYTGLSFVGEAKSSMFRNGKFPIVVVDGAGRLVGVSFAVAQNTWSVPGWVRFETRINYVLPNKVPCTMIFEEALTQTEKVRQPVRVALPIRCN